MSVADVVGPGRGDVAGLSTLAARLRRAAAVLRAGGRAPEGVAVLDAAAAVEAAAAALRELPLPAPAGRALQVEAALAQQLTGLLTVLDREGTR